MAAVLSPEAIDALVADARDSGVPLDGRDGLLGQMMKAVVERALRAEMADHLGYEAGDPAGRGSGNNRNGSYGKTLTTTAGPVEIDVPRDRQGDFEPRIVPKGTRRLGQVDEMILSLYARGMTTRDITAHLYEVYGAQVSPALVSKVTDVIADEVASWQARPLDECYPILYIDAIRIKVRDSGHVVNKAAHLVIGVDTEGVKNVLGIWLQDNEGAKFWLHVLTQLKHRGLRDALIVCCDGLKGLPEAIEAVWPAAITQTCVVHLIRSALKYVNSTDRKKVAAALKPIYTAVDETAALEALESVREDWGRQYPGAISVFENAWEQFIPFLDFDQDIRRVIYTTNAIESMNRNLRKLIKTSGHFPSDDAAMKMLYLGIRNIEGRHIDGNGKVPTGRIRGTGTLGWTRAMNQFKIRFGDRLPL
ncbi:MULTISPECIES: IS256 family transposase [unclassified Streptomyces]|uniref:IS256 family transposase n=1 Tax=unclassified Streptomyces TaxID=2593676 RepID=UPI002270202B|nr:MULTISPECIES: IS256 family transposase [unclassified Streptomyces]MCY0924356.1 IS256 family transposase [Streptomyces sp. H27-G5]MCY0963487.1 IS256 family transposase [Streptomyces sp. H27-H5]